MTKRLGQCRTGLLAVAGTVALLAVVAVPVAAGGNGHGKSNNRLLAAGTATERVGAGQWHIQFQIHARNNGKSSKVSVQTPTSTFSYVGSVCSGSFRWLPPARWPGGFRPETGAASLLQRASRQLPLSV